MKLYVGNLPYEITDDQLRELVAPFGTPTSAEVAKDRSTGQARGFGFVEFANDDEARAAVAGLDGKEVKGRALKVNEARAKTGGKR
ncbi:MAG TPA: RNA-binding protein [Thermoanaerobaculia bacterium]|nr:RNA-binding protein [Thermoanaerobaculia bacterium]